MLAEEMYEDSGAAGNAGMMVGARRLATLSGTPVNYPPRRRRGAENSHEGVERH